MLEVDFHDNPSGAEYLITHRIQIAEAIAKVIIESEGKKFVPTTNGEYIDQAIRLGIFPAHTKWDSPLTKEDAAIITMRLLKVIRKGVNL